MKIPTVWQDAYPRSTKQKAVLDAARAEGLLDEEAGSNIEFDAAATWAAIASVHDAARVKALRAGPAERAEALARTWRGQNACTWLARACGVAFHPVSGGPEAGPEGGDASPFNLLVGVPQARMDIREIGRAMVIDFDARQGAGTWALAGRALKKFAIFDVSTRANGVKPKEQGNRYVRVVKTADEYASALERLRELAQAFGPDVMTYQAGVDCHEYDPAGGLPGMTAERLASRDRIVIETARDLELPLVINLGAGGDDAASAALHVQTLRIASEVYG